MTEKVNYYTAVDAVNAIRSGDLHPSKLVQACLDRIEEREEAIHAWEFIDGEGALQQARDLESGKTSMPLYGIPVGIKDIIDTDDMPTAYGSPIFAGHRPEKNAECIRRLQDAGAIIMGKTVTTEFAYLEPGKTRNPHNPAHTPGGSSSGSAAAVADFHVPLALGTQTAGSIIRPASYCGVVGYKPTFDSFPSEGIHPFAPSLDTLGGFARCVQDIVLLANVLGNREMQVKAEPARKVAIVHGPSWSQAQGETRSMLEQCQVLLKQSGADVVVKNLGDEFAAINEAQRYIQLNECTHALADYYKNHRQGLSEKLLRDYEIGLGIGEDDMRQAYALVAECKDSMARLFSDADMIITPASVGSAPLLEAGTGDPVFNRMWTAMHLPCISLPFPMKRDALPLGIQLVGPIQRDRQLLAHALWLELLISVQINNH